MYITARGGEEAIQEAERFFHRLKGPVTGDFVRRIEQTLPYLLDRVMGEASLYAPHYAALAIAQTGGDLHEAVMLLRAYRSTQPRLAYALPAESAQMLVVRRISAAFKDIPGGQMLGPTLDYSHRLLDTSLLNGRAPEEAAVPIARGESSTSPVEEPAPGPLPFVADWHRAQGLLAPRKNPAGTDPASTPDITREPISFPARRGHRLQALARASTDGVLALGYANMRGYGAIHPTVNEVRLAYAEVRLRHPVTGVVFSAGRVRVSMAEVVSPTKLAHGNDETGDKAHDAPELELGFCATLGWNEVKTIAGAMLDLAMDKPNPHPAHEEEFVLYHTEPVEAAGFCVHYKLPHYVTFGSDLDAVRRVAAASGWEKVPNAGPARGRNDGNS